MTVQKIALFSLVGAGAVGGSVAGIYHFSKDKTIEDSLKRKGTKLINSEDEYGATFLKWKNNESFKATIPNIQDVTNFQQGSLALKNWCEENFKLVLTNKEAETKLQKVEDYCSKQSLNIQERLNKARKKLIADGGWATKYGEIKTPDKELAKDLNISSITGEDSNNTKAGQVLQNWCNKNIKTELINDKNEETYKKIESRCLQK